MLPEFEPVHHSLHTSCKIISPSVLVSSQPKGNDIVEMENSNGEKKKESRYPLQESLKNSLSYDHATKLHIFVLSFLNIGMDGPLAHIYHTVAGLCDPYTQPEENDEMLLSIDCLADLLISLTYTNRKYLDSNDDDDDGDEVKLESNELSDDNSHNTDDQNDELSDIMNNPDINSIKFELSTQFFTILQDIQANALNCTEELNLRFVDNDINRFFENLIHWTTKVFIGNIPAIRLCYSISCVLLVAIYKLFKPESGEYNLAINPYFQYFISAWKCHSNIIILGLEIDRKLESEESKFLMETPETIKEVLRGSSAIRNVLGWIVNQNPSLYYTPEEAMVAGDYSLDHDIKNESLLDFAHPLVRKNINGGSLKIDMRLVVIALLIVNSGVSYVPGAYYSSDRGDKQSEEEMVRRIDQSKPISDIGDLLVDLEYEDKFDEDISYIWGCEYLDSEEEEEEEEQEEQEVEEEERVKEDNNDEGTNEIKPVANESTSRRSLEGSQNIDFDDQGRDWRDIVRGDNARFSDWFVELVDKYNSSTQDEKRDSDNFFSLTYQLSQALDFVLVFGIEGNEEAEHNVGQVILNTISKSIMDKNAGKVSEFKNGITFDWIYLYLTSPASKGDIAQTQDNNKLLIPIFEITKFELIFLNNNKLARCILDEMLMCDGSRRLIIWFLTHNVNLSALLIDYVYELLSDLRGTNDSTYLSTRQGNFVVLSDVERLMLLHEFLNHSGVFLSACDGVEVEEGVKLVLAESIAKKLVTLLCLMITRLISAGLIVLDRRVDEDDIHGYFNVLQMLLINWIGKVPEARKLFFQIKNRNNPKEDDPDQEEGMQKEPSEKLLDIVEPLAKELETLQLIIDDCSRIEIWSIKDYFSSSSSSWIYIIRYTHRMEAHLKTIIAIQNNEIDQLDKNKQDFGNLEYMAKDFRFFLVNFNTLCKIEIFAETMFALFEKIVTTGRIGNEEDTEGGEGENSVEAEFNDDFLNGDLDDSKGNDKSEASKSKKKKKKKKSKKK